MEASFVFCAFDFQCIGNRAFPDSLSNLHRKFFATALISFVISLVFYWLIRYLNLSAVRWRQLFLISTGVYIYWAVLQWHAIHIYIVLLGLYLQLRTIPAKYLPYTAVLSAYSYLSFRLLHFMLIDQASNALHDSGFMMIQLARCSYVVFGYYDGYRSKKQGESLLTKLQQQHAIYQKPTFIEFASYVLYSPCIFIGPTIPYTVFTNYISLPTSELSKRPSFVWQLAQRLILIVSFSFMFLRLEEYAQSDWVINNGKPVIYNWTISVLIGALMKVKYYISMLIGEAICTASGIGFSHFDIQSGQPVFGNSVNMRILDCMFPVSPKTLMSGWHITIAVWLRYLVYERVTMFPTFAVFIVSALWHGFYPGIYFGMLYGAFLVLAGRNMRKLLNHHFKNSNRVVKRLYDMCTIIVTVFFADPFMLVYLGSKWEVVWPLIKEFMWMPGLICISVALVPVKRSNTSGSTKEL